MGRQANGLETDGRRAFAAVVARASQAKVAAELGIAQQSVSRYLAGLQRPGDLLRELMHRLYGVEPASWWTAEEKRRLKAARAA